MMTLEVSAKRSDVNLLGGLIPTHSWRQLVDAIAIPALASWAVVYLSGIDAKFMLGGFVAGFAACCVIWLINFPLQVEIRPANRALYNELCQFLDSIASLRHIAEGIYVDRRPVDFMSHWKITDVRITLDDGRLVVAVPSFLIREFIRRIERQGCIIVDAPGSEFIFAKV